MEEYEAKWRKSISATTADFQIDEETNRTKVRDGAREIIGGMITGKTIKHTKTGKPMAFLTIEDLLGTVEVVVFPKDYEKNRNYLNEDSKVFVKGRVSEEDDNASKLICEGIIPFEEISRDLWIQFEDKQKFMEEESKLYEILKESQGRDNVVIYLTKEKAVKRLPASYNVHADSRFLSRLIKYFGETRVKVVEKAIENRP